MKTRRAPRRYLDCYIALLEGFCTVESPSGPVLVPEGMVDPDWPWRDDIAFDSFVPEFTRDFTSGAPVLAQYGVTMALDSPNPLEDGIRTIVRHKFGKRLPPLPGIPKNWRKR